MKSSHFLSDKASCYSFKKYDVVIAKPIGEQKFALAEFGNFMSETSHEISSNINLPMETEQGDHLDQKLKELEYIQFQQIISEVEDYAILVLDPSGIIQSWNVGVKKIKGYNASEIIGEHYSMFFTEEDCLEMWPQRLLDDASVMGRTERSGWCVRKNDGMFWSKMTITPLHSESGRLIGYTEIVKDLTYYREKEQKVKEIRADLDHKIQDRTAQLEEEVEALTQELQAFSYSVSHDLKAPLRAITGYSSILLEGYHEGLDSEGKSLLEVIHRNVEKLNLLMQGVLSFSRLNRKKLTCQTIDMKDVFVHAYYDLVGAEPSSRNIEFRIGQLPDGYGDLALIAQAVRHLLSNALKYTKYSTQAVIQIMGEQNEGACVYYVKDNGVGFDEKYKDKLFEIFQRLHKEREFEGIGLGLASVQQIIRKHGGKVDGKSQPDQGATFYFTLPLEPK